MARATRIPYARSTLNPWIGCTKVSVAHEGIGGGCDNCYAEVMDARCVFGGETHWGSGVPRLRTSPENWEQVRSWNRQAPQSEFAGYKGFWPVFSASLGDIFDNEVPEAWRHDFWDLVRECKNLTFLIITKRVGNAPKMLPQDWGDGYPNVCLIITVVDQKEADRDIPKLLRIPAATRGLSMEPLLGGVDLAPWLTELDWVIVGFESGKNARPGNLNWARFLRDQCKKAGVPYFFKQHGAWREAKIVAGGDLGGEMRRDQVRIVKYAGENDGRFKQGDVMMRRVKNKKDTVDDRLLDGVLHSGFPIRHVSPSELSASHAL